MVQKSASAELLPPLTMVEKKRKTRVQDRWQCITKIPLLYDLCDPTQKPLWLANYAMPQPLPLTRNDGSNIGKNTDNLITCLSGVNRHFLNTTVHVQHDMQLRTQNALFALKGLNTQIRQLSCSITTTTTAVYGVTISTVKAQQFSATAGRY